ncbi:unnamed protein product [Nesidiocoris tenuis]|uniref:Uncharacterized protein n=1 Tax=Nesidiocoris tenuis TaxID=355587 RepID=A0A6H5HEX8_9HEMI|nr:unnamed protein product [Nesidiocoris tenuis]
MKRTILGFDIMRRSHGMNQRNEHGVSSSELIGEPKTVLRGSNVVRGGFQAFRPFSKLRSVATSEVQNIVEYFRGDFRRIWIFGRRRIGRRQVGITRNGTENGVVYCPASASGLNSTGEKEQSLGTWESEREIEARPPPTVEQEERADSTLSNPPTRVRAASDVNSEIMQLIMII